MAREGREFELLIEKLEKILLPSKAIIKSPDFIEDKITKQKREVDISIRMDVGSVPIIIVIECRDRKSDQDTTWIEQLNTKIRDLNADKVIAVSSSGFSANAITKATHYGIETRTYGEISAEAIGHWCGFKFITRHLQHYVFRDIRLCVDDNMLLLCNPLEGKTNGNFLLTKTTDKSKVNLNSIFEGEAKAINLWTSIPYDDELHRRTVRFDFINPQNRYEIECNKTVIPITSIIFVVDLKNEVTNIPISKVTAYSGKDGPITETLEFEGMMPDKNTVLQIIKAKDGRILLSARNKDYK